MQQHSAPQQPLSLACASFQTANTSRPNRLLCRRGLPDLPELTETEDDGVSASDDISTNTFSTRHSNSTSMSSHEFPSLEILSASLTAATSKTAILPHTRLDDSFHEPYTQEPPGGVKQLQTPFEYVYSTPQTSNPLLREGDSPPSLTMLQDEVSATTGMGYELNTSLTTSNEFHEVSGGGMVEPERHQGGIRPDVYGGDEHPLEECSGCPASCHRYRRSSGPYHYPSSPGEVNCSEVGECMSPPSSPGTDCDSEHDDFYDPLEQPQLDLDRPRSPSLLIDNDAFSSVLALPPFTSFPVRSDESPVERMRPSRGLLGRRGTAVLNKVLPRSLRLKHWSSTPILPKLRILSPPPLPRISPSVNTLLSPTLCPRTPGPPVPPNTAFDYDPYSDQQSDDGDDDDDETRRPTTRGTVMSREQLPTPPLHPTLSPTLPYIPPLELPGSSSFPLSPSSSVHSFGLLNQLSLFSPVQPDTRNNSLTSLSNQSLTSNTPISSPTFASPRQRPLDIHSPSKLPAAAGINISSPRSPGTPQHLFQASHRQFPPTVSEEIDIKDLLQQMDLENNAFAAAEQRMAASGWSTEAELSELREKRQAVRREWEERIEKARKKTRRSDSISAQGSSHGANTSDPPATPVITLHATPNGSTTALPSANLP